MVHLVLVVAVRPRHVVLAVPEPPANVFRVVFREGSTLFGDILDEQRQHRLGGQTLIERELLHPDGEGVGLAAGSGAELLPGRQRLRPKAGEHQRLVRFLFLGFGRCARHARSTLFRGYIWYLASGFWNGRARSVRYALFRRLILLAFFREYGIRFVGTTLAFGVLDFAFT
ncbi:MAG: hypothetical protein AAGF32_05865 [Pseudomonadota bacterium]